MSKQTVQAFGRFLEAMFGPGALERLDPDVARWEDDGGPPAPDPIKYTHTIVTEPVWEPVDVYRVNDGTHRFVGTWE